MNTTAPGLRGMIRPGPRALMSVTKLPDAGPRVLMRNSRLHGRALRLWDLGTIDIDEIMAYQVQEAVVMLEPAQVLVLGHAGERADGGRGVNPPPITKRHVSLHRRAWSSAIG
jgi:hypothetical protein